MLVGNRDRFAIEYTLDADYGGAWLFGKFCYWINGIMVGRFEEGVSLREVLVAMKYIAGDCGNRFSELLWKLSNEDAFARLNYYFYSETVIDESEPGSLLPEIPARFNASLNVDIFDGCTVFILQGADREKILFRIPTAETLQTITLVQGEFDELFRQAHAGILALYEREVGLA